MPQLDRLLSVMVSNRAEALRLVENELASLVKDGATVPLTKQALGATQLLGLLREIAPPDAMRRLEEGTPAEFEYRSGDGVFNATATNASESGTGQPRSAASTNACSSSGTRIRVCGRWPVTTASRRCGSSPP